MPTVEMNGARFDCDISGDGPPLVLVHGSCSDRRTWGAVERSFALNHRTLSYSRRFHRPNAAIPPDTDYAMAQQVDDLRALVSTTFGEPAHVVGHSYGGYLALLLAMSRPELVRSLVLGEPPVIPLVVRFPPRPADLLRLLARDPLTGLALVRFVAGGVVPATAAFRHGDSESALRAFGQASLGRSTFRSLSATRLQQARENLIAMELLGSGFLPLDAHAVAGIELPVLLLTGQDSPLLLRRLSGRLAMLIPHAETGVIRGASHIMHEDRPDEFVAIVGSFLRRHST